MIRRSDSFQAQYRERRELAYHRVRVEIEQAAAHHVFRSKVDRDRLDLPNTRYSLSPMSLCNGALLLAAEKPDGSANLLIGDFTGHGPTAATGSLPAADVFYAISAKGFGIEEVMAETNRRLAGLLPAGIFLAACGIEFNRAQSSARIWIGGIPDVLIRRRGGANPEQLPACRVPTGVPGREPDSGFANRLSKATDRAVEPSRGGRHSDSRRRRTRPDRRSVEYHGEGDGG